MQFKKIYIYISSYFILLPVSTLRMLSNDLMTKPTKNIATRYSLNAPRPACSTINTTFFGGKKITDLQQCGTHKRLFSVQGCSAEDIS